MNNFFYFILYSFIGWMIESTYVSIQNKKWINSGFLYGPICPIYGLGAMIVLSIPQSFSILHVFLFSILFTSILEYLTSLMMEKLFHRLWWNYSHYKYHLHGRICLINSFLFGCMSIFTFYVFHPIFQLWIQHFSKTTFMSFTSIVLSLFFIDSMLSIKKALTQMKRDWFQSLL